MPRRTQSSSSTPTSSPPTFAMNRDRLRRMEKVATSRFGEKWRPATEVLVEVRSVQTIFPGIDAVTRVGGWPIDRFGLLHGPSNEGKTEFMFGLGASFLQRGHFYAHIDAEYTTPARWLRTLLGVHAANPCFRALRPRTYEETVDAVRMFCEAIGEAKAKGEIEPDTTGLIGLDSIRKLVPKALFERLAKEGADGEAKGEGRHKKKPGGVDGFGGRAAQIKAALNAAWVDELIPLLAQTGTAMIVIARETADDDAFGQGFKVGGGGALYYDSSLVARIQRASYVRDGTGKDAPLYGEKRSVEIHKTKVGGKDERLPEAYYHTSNGMLVPEGFDAARDLLMVGRDFDIVTAAGSHVSWGKVKLGNGEHAAVRKLYANPTLLAGLEEQVRDAIARRDREKAVTL